MALNLVKKFNFDMLTCKCTHVATTIKVTKNAAGDAVYQTLYRSMIGSLLYLTTNRTDICYAIDIRARFQANPKESHLAIVKNIIRFVKGACNFILWYSKDTTRELSGLYDANWPEI